jgi:hypothetical protein
MANTYPVRAAINLVRIAFNALLNLLFAGATAVAAAAAVFRRLSAQVDGMTVVQGAAHVLRGLAARIDGTTTVSAAAATARALAADIDGATDFDAGLALVDRPISAAINGATSVAASVRATGAVEVLATGEFVVDTDGNQTLLTR